MRMLRAALLCGPLLLSLLRLSTADANAFSVSQFSEPNADAFETAQNERLWMWTATRQEDAANGAEEKRSVLLNDADVLLGVSIPIRFPVSRGANASDDSSSSTRCGRVSENGLQTLEAVLYSLDYVNQLELLRPFNVTLGAVVLDDCDNNFRGVENALAFSYARLVKVRCDTNESAAFGAERKVVGVVGSSKSEVSIALAGLLAASQMPQVRPDAAAFIKTAFGLAAEDVIDH